MKQTNVSNLLSLKVTWLSKPVKDRLLSMPQGFENLLCFAQSARAGDQEPMTMTIPGGEMVMEWEDGGVRFSLDFLSDGELVAELDEDQLTFHGIEIPEAVAISEQGHKLDDFISLPEQMADLQPVKALSISTTQNGFQMVLQNPSLSLEAKDLLERQAGGGRA